MLTVELSHLADVLESAGKAGSVSEMARNYSVVIADAIWKYTVRLICWKYFVVLTCGLVSRQSLCVRDERVGQSICHG